MTVRAKFEVKDVVPGQDAATEVVLWPVTGGSPENEAFYAATPGGGIELVAMNPAAAAYFEPGKAYYVDFRREDEAGEGVSVGVAPDDVVVLIAGACHEANRLLCLAIGDDSAVAWEDAPQWQKFSAVSGVRFQLANPNAPASASHENWLKDKEAAGWVFGEEKSAATKTHPCMVPFDELPVEQQAKDHLFKLVCHNMAQAFTAAILNAPETAGRPDQGPVLMSPANPNGWKLEELAAQLRDEVKGKCLKILEDDRPVARSVLHNNQLILGKLRQIEELLGGIEAAQRDSYAQLDAMAPNEGPLGTPRIGEGSN